MYTIFRTYDFIAVTERLFESLVVMKLLFHLPDEAIIVANGKQHGAFDMGRNTSGIGWCNRIQPSHTSPSVDEFLASPTNRLNNHDFILYQAAVRSLDKTIDALGKERVEKEMERLSEIQQLARDYCQDKFVLPCQEEGQYPNMESLKYCTYTDVGCGKDCMMEFVRNYNAGGGGGTR